MDRFDAAAAIADLVAKDEIKQAIANLQRGLDRRDGVLLGSAFHAGAKVDYGFFNGPAAEFRNIMTGGPDGPAHQVTMHRPTNIWIRVDGNRAVSESYVFAYSPGGEGTDATQALIGGRYLDRHEHRADEWRLTHRTYVLDWNINRPGSGSVLPDFPQLFLRGGWRTDDPGLQRLHTWRIGEAAAQRQGGKMKISQTLAAKAERAFAKGEIHDLIAAAARAVDRGDEASLRALWHPGADVDNGDFFRGPAADFCALMAETARNSVRMAHSVANEWVQVDGDEAMSETYVIAMTTSATDDGERDALTGGRYLDRFERIDGAWKFSHRTFVLDWQIQQPSTDQRDDPDGMYAALTTRGCLYPEDPVYSFWNKP